MLKAIQILGSSSGFVLNRFKIHGNCSFSFISVSSSRSPASLLLPNLSPRENRRSIAFRSSSARSRSSMDSSVIRAEVNSDGNNPCSSSSPAPVKSQSTGESARRIKFCQSCGGKTKHEIPDGEEKLRAVCTDCGKIAYENPKMVVGCLIEHGNKILLCKRNIQPSYGLWTLPAGYMEIGESAAEGAIRETWEEAGAEVDVLSPFVHLDIPLIGQAYIIFLAKLKSPLFSPGPESSECRLFGVEEIPFDSLAFSSMLVTLNLYIEDRKTGNPKFHYGTINKRPGTSPSDIQAYTLDYHVKL